MISLTIDVRGATTEQMKQFGEISGMRDALHELLYRSRGHTETTLAVLGGTRVTGSPNSDDFLSLVVGLKEVAKLGPQPEFSDEECSEIGC